jgi:DNA-binding MarR family transcriptional regulator
MLAAALKVTPSNVTGIIDRLVEQGLVTRAENPDDRRMLMLQLTSQGETLISGLRERRFSQMSAVLIKLNEDELETISRSFKILGKAIEEYSRSGQGLS